jgi:broad specificity phosphatase PhoE
MTTRIHLIRHAESEINLQEEGIIGGRSNWSELTHPQGILQSRSLGRRLQEEHLKVLQYYSSPAIRTQQTARYSNEHKPIRPLLDQKLIELDQGDFEGASRTKIYQRPDVRKSLELDNWNFIPGDQRRGESQAMVAKRMMLWLEEATLTHQGGDLIAYTHGVAIKTLLAKLGLLNQKLAYQQPLMNTSITTLEKTKSTYYLLRINDYKHLIQDKIPFLN